MLKAFRWFLVLVVTCALYALAFAGRSPEGRSPVEAQRGPIFDPIRPQDTPDARPARPLHQARSNGGKSAVTSASDPSQEQQSGSTTEPGAMTIEQMGAQIQQVMAQEPTDPAWQHSGSEMITTHVQEMLPEGSSIAAISCRSSWCSFSTTHPNQRDYKTFVGRLVHLKDGFERGPVLSAIARESPGGEVMAHNYLGKLGTNLPGAVDPQEPQQATPP